MGKILTPCRYHAMIAEVSTECYRRLRLMADSENPTSRKALTQALNDLQTRLARLSDSEQQWRETEQRLQESEQRYRTLTQNIALGLYRRTAGIEGKIVMANAAMARMFRYESETQLLDRPITDLYWDPSECRDFSAQMFKDRQVIKRHLKMKRRDGTPIWISVTATAICDHDGGPVYFDGILEDITERKQMEAEKAVRQQQLIQADKMITLGILVSGVAHEINNPNQFIVSNLGPLKRCIEDALPILDRYGRDNGDFMMGGRRYSQRRKQIPDMFANILKGSERIKGIVEELRDYAREHPADITETIHINHVVTSALALLSNLLKNSTHHFSVSYGHDIPPVKGNYQRIEQVLINLIQNACQALPDKDRPLSVTTYHNRGRQCVCVEVADKGVGIDPEDLKHIKDPFFTTKRSMGGTGLGLSISASILDSHGGTLEFESNVGQGTTVLMTLPCTSETLS